MAASLRQMVLKWDVDRDRRVLGNLVAYKARARGRRIRELVLLGLEAERVGFRVLVVDGVAGVVPPESFLTAGVTQQLPAGASPGTVEVAASDGVQPLSEVHRAGLSAMMDALDL